jgi:hypothetical protein
MGKIIDFQKARATLRARVKDCATRSAKDERELTKQDILLVLSCDPMASARTISHQLWEDFNMAGERLVHQILKEMREEGLISYGPKEGWHLEPAAKEALDEIFKTEEKDE